MIGELARHRNRVGANGGGARVVALKVERTGEPAEQANAQFRGLDAERGSGFLEQLDRALVGYPWTPARILEADRGLASSCGLASSRAIADADR